MIFDAYCPFSCSASPSSFDGDARFTTRRLPENGDTDFEFTEVEVLEKVLGARERLEKEDLGGDVGEALGEAIRKLFLFVAL